MYLKLFQRKTNESRIVALAKTFQRLANQVCESRTELKPDDVIKAAQEMASKWPIGIESVLGKAVAQARLNLPLPWEK